MAGARCATVRSRGQGTKMKAKDKSRRQFEPGTRVEMEEIKNWVGGVEAMVECGMFIGNSPR